MYLSLALIATGQSKDAQPLLRRALLLSPSHPQALAALRCCQDEPARKKRPIISPKIPVPESSAPVPVPVPTASAAKNAAAANSLLNSQSAITISIRGGGSSSSTPELKKSKTVDAVAQHLQSVVIRDGSPVKAPVMANPNLHPTGPKTGRLSAEDTGGVTDAGSDSVTDADQHQDRQQQRANTRSTLETSSMPPHLNHPTAPASVPVLSVIAPPVASVSPGGTRGSFRRKPLEPKQPTGVVGELVIPPSDPAPSTPKDASHRSTLLSPLKSPKPILDGANTTRDISRDTASTAFLIQKPLVPVVDPQQPPLHAHTPASVPVHDPAPETPNPGTRVQVPYEQLKAPGPFPPGVDPAHRERHLMAPEFHSLFGMDLEEFLMEPKWKQADKKKRLKLF